VSLLIRISNPEEEKIERIELPAKFGRAPDCDISLLDEGISRYHFVIDKEGEKVFLKDLGSRNGTFLNGREVFISVLKKGDIITAGNTSFEIIEIEEKIPAKEITEIIKSSLTEPPEKLIKRLGGIIRLQTDEVLGGIPVLNPSSVPVDYELLSSISNLITLKTEMNEVKERLRKLEKFLPPGISSIIREEKLTFEPSLLEITVLFCDIVGFTGMCERIHIKETAEFIKFFYALLNKLANENNGWVNKFLGDGAMIIFGVPFFTKDHPIEAVRTALNIKRELEKVKMGKEEIRIRIGINTGVCLVGGIEAGERIEWTVIGDAVNIASRLEKMAYRGEIFIGEETWKSVREKFKTKYTGTISLRGRKGKTRIYEVLEES